MTPRIHCLGILVLDALSGPLARYPEPRACTQVVTRSIRFAAGGGAANTAGALAKMGLTAGVFAKIGDDLSGAFLMRELAHAGVDTAGVRLAPGEATPFTFVGVHPDGERTFIHTPGTNLTFSPDDIDRETLYAADFLLYQDCWVLPQMDGEPGARLLAEARRRGITTALDECWGLGPRRDTLEALLPHCDYFLPSFDDLRTVYPDCAPPAMAEHLLSLGVRTVVLKMGRDGCLVARGTERLHVPALPAQAVDTTGAGDCWDAGFIAALARGEEVSAAARVGHACAAFGIEAVGGCSGVPAYEEVRRRAAATRIPPT